MSVGDKVVVSKRRGTTYVTDGMEKGKRIGKHEEMGLEEQDRRTSGSRTTTNSSLEPSPVTRPADAEHDIETLSLGSSSELRDAFHPPTTSQHVSYSIHELEESLQVEGRPTNFGIVVPGVYRSSFPQSEDYAFIEGLKLKTIV